MKKLFNLKEWLTVADTARHLSQVFEHDVTEADVLRLAIDGRLRLSVYFVNRAKARCGQIVPIAEAEYKEVPSLEGTGTVRLYKGPSLFSADGTPSHVIELEETVVSLAGVYDLTMLGDELQEIEHRYQMLTGGPAVTTVGLDGSFVKGRSEKICQLQDEERNHPMGGLPEDSVLVVRTDVLREFEESIGKVAPSEDSVLPPSQQRGSWTDEKLRKLWNLHNQPGMTKTKLAAHFGIKRQAIDKPLKRAQDKFSGNPKGRPFGL